MKGEGTDSHSRVVAGDPLAGAASILRGRDRLLKGLSTGSITELQAGRAAVVRGVVKAVPGQNLKQKQDLRKTVENVVVPVAGGLFAIWALRQGHEAAKVLFPAYEKGPGKNVEDAVNSAVSSVLDVVPFYGGYRQAQRKNAYLRAQYLARNIAFATQNDPADFDNNQEVFPNLSRNKVSGLRDALATATEHDTDGIAPRYSNFRARILSRVLGAQADGHSVYTEPATLDFLARQYGIDRSSIVGVDNTAKKRFVLGRITSTLRATGTSMRSDMLVRGLDPNKAEDVDAYAEVALKNAAKRFGVLKPDQQEQAFSSFRGAVRELVIGQRGGDIGPSTIAKQQYDNTFAAFDSYFKESARRIEADVNPTRSVVAPPASDSPLRTTLIGVAERLKRRVRITAPITGANHAELVLQRVYHEVTVPRRYNSNSKSTWIASDSDIKYAAQDMGWDNSGGIEGAFAFLKRSGQFPRLTRSNLPTPQPRRLPQPPEPGSRTRRQGQRRLRTREELISMLLKAGKSQAAAEAEADRIIARRQGG